jgi:3-keto-disaccharide hydrolase
VVGRVKGQNDWRITQGDKRWADYEFSVFGTLVAGSNLQVCFRLSEDGKSYYFLDFLTGWQAVAISKRDGDTGQIVKLSVVNYVIEKGREYHIVVAARGRSLTSYIDGKVVNQLTDDAFTSGGVGLNMWSTTTAIFRDPKIRHYQ